MSRKAWSRIPKAKLRMEGSGFFLCGYNPSLSRNVAFIFLSLTLLYTFSVIFNANFLASILF